jgi:cell division protein FtsN
LLCPAQAVLRRLLQNTGQGKHTQQLQQPDSPAAQENSTDSSSDAVSTTSTSSSPITRPKPPTPHPQLQALLQDQAAAGEVLYLLRALAAWRDQNADVSSRG